MPTSEPAVLVDPAAVVDALSTELPVAGSMCAVVVLAGRGLGLATANACWAVPSAEPAAVAASIAEVVRPRWVWWSANSAASALVENGFRPQAAWDLAAVHRLLHGGWAAGPDVVWAGAQGLPASGIPTVGQLDLLGESAGAGGGADPEGEIDQPVRPDGYLRPDWSSQTWLAAPGSLRPEFALTRAARWARLALSVAHRQQAALERLPDPRPVRADPPLAVLTARSESIAELIAVELGHDGLPLDRESAESYLLPLIGPRPIDSEHEAQLRGQRDAEVRGHLPGTDVRNPALVKAALADLGIDVPDTRSWRLREFLGAHPAIEALLAWRKLDRIATTYGYSWLDRHLGADGRLRGGWGGSDGAAGRMTAQSGQHNMPSELRRAVRAEPGMAFVRADLGQVEPRVLAAVSRDRALAAATADDDLYAPVADQLGCDRATAKIAVLAAMYGQTSGAAGAALRRMERTYPVALRYLREADQRGRDGRDVRTYGGRLVRMWPAAEPDPSSSRGERDDRRTRAAVAARGRFARNAMIQGAAAELFKMWAATVRARVAPLGGRIVLCLHDELLVHVPRSAADQAASLVEEALREVAARWSGGDQVRFVADLRVLERWSDAKTGPSPGLAADASDP